MDLESQEMEFRCKFGLENLLRLRRTRYFCVEPADLRRTRCKIAETSASDKVQDRKNTTQLVSKKGPNSTF
jgi:hypothetical protein